MTEQSNEIVHACPECGNVLANTCYHEGHDLRAIDMPAAKAAELRRDHAEASLTDVDISELDTGTLVVLADEIDAEIKRRKDRCS